MALDLRERLPNDGPHDVLRQYIQEPFDANIEGSIEDWQPVNRKLGLTGEELATENDFQEATRKALRLKLSNWFRHCFNGKWLHSAGVNKILQRMQNMSGNAVCPQRKPNVTVYSSKYYASKLKEGFDTSGTGLKGHSPTCWEKESDEVKEEIAREADTQYKAAMTEYRALNSILEASAERSQLTWIRALETFDELGIPLADVLAERLGMHVVIMAVGLVGDQRGEVRLCSVFSDTSHGQMSKIWGEFDNTAFTAAKVSLTHYRRAFFTRDQCRARAWPPLKTPGLEGLIRMDVPTGQQTVSTPLTPSSITPAPSSITPVPASAPPAPSTPPTTNPTTLATSSIIPVPASVTLTPSCITPAVNTAMVSATSAVPAPRAEKVPTPPSRSPLPPLDQYQYRWSETQMDIHNLMVKKKWGPRWKELIKAVIAYKESIFWHDTILPRSRLHPGEIGTWMKEHQKAGNFNKILPKDIGPAFRQGPRPEGLAETEEWPPKTKAEETPGAWCMLQASGNNGFILAVRVLMWWGQLIVNQAAGGGLGAGEEALVGDKEWQYMLGELLYVLECMTEEMDEEEKAALELERANELTERNWVLGGKRGKKPKPMTKLPAKPLSPKPGTAPRLVPPPSRKQPARKSPRAAEQTDGGVGATATTFLALGGGKRSGSTAATDGHGKQEQSGGTGGGGAQDNSVEVVASTGAEALSTKDSHSAEAFPTMFSNAGEDIEMPVVPQEHMPTNISAENREDSAEDHPFGSGFDDPFNGDPLAGLSAEERAEIENNPDADEDDEDIEDDKY
ncbi:hypothetical protein B0H14DRAFT_2620397 [Mycena olivaceomarginata]|nr:hypothetical protein B0H14DRAFT_2620397 [Mycena olivaceomarginata]